MSIYTREELIDKIKAIDAKLEKSIKESEVDTQQNRQRFEINNETLLKQKDDYKQQLANLNVQGAGLVRLVSRPRRRWFGC